MPKDFNVAWNVKRAGLSVVHVPMHLHYCRDIAYHAMTRQLFEQFTTATQVTFGDDRYFNLGWKRWVERNADQLTFECAVSFPYIGAIESYTKLIAKVAPFYPEVEFSIVEHDMTILRLEGNAEVIPAFYWIVVWSRAPILDMAHQTLWEKVEQRADLPGIACLVTRSGPMTTSTILKQGWGSDREMQRAIQETASPTHARHRWFHDEEA